MTVRGAMGLPVVGMVGGGQLSRMTHQAAIALGLSVVGGVLIFLRSPAPVEQPTN